MNKKSQYSPGFGIFIALAIIIVGGFTFIIFNFALSQHIIPAIETAVNQSIGNYGFSALNATSIAEENTKINLFWTSSLAIMFLIAILYMILNGMAGSEQ